MEDVSSIQILIIVIAIVLKLGLLTCVISHYKMGARSWSDGRGRPPPKTTGAQEFLQTPRPQQQKLYLPTPNYSVLYTQQGAQEKKRFELAAQQEKQIRQHSVQTDLTLDLPASVTLPDGEEYPYGNSKLLHLRDSQQESEICRGCIRPPPNRTVLQGDNPITKPANLSSKSCASASVLRTIDKTPLVITPQSISGGDHHQGGGLSHVLPSYFKIPVPMCGRATARRASSTSESGCRGQITFEAANSPPRYSDIIQNHDLCRFSGQSESGV
ncbi:uncharacterized protein LOC143241112 isoform X1 [Tachypleus tridentatus]|uniref:uncharacterized protein LOC143241112 isoform X1 n=2 Tax=Tachypleus tridentatus TaxID=6853 RepID=UPI003FD278B9